MHGVCFTLLPCSTEYFSAERCGMIRTVCHNLFEACSVLFRSLFGVRCLTFSQLKRMHRVNLKQICFLMLSLMAWKTGMAKSTLGGKWVSTMKYRTMFWRCWACRAPSGIKWIMRWYTSSKSIRMIGLPWIQVELQVSMSFLTRVAIARLTSRCSGASICTTGYTKKLQIPMALF